MLKLSNIVKTYDMGDTRVEALRGVSMSFRKSEFVSVLGPSGCGKTTLLNIIGGLDQYSDGDLVINGRSTKKFKDRDWDTYRNHSIGFVFQSYNLIPHQTVLSNVELALTLSGVSKKERRQRATEALEKVGLGDQLKKRPSQMSGGQMQRVAIARAIVNDPDILLADEPTGALDTETSVQVMEILKEISKDRLIIMVTHNPDLAEKYSTRVIKLLDGKVVDDSMPFDGEEAEKEESSETRPEKSGKASMSFLTALSLSFNNLMTKKGRTFLTAFAGAIGIIGIALILSLSDGFQKYIDKVQEDTLSTYPISIDDETLDVSAILRSMTGNNEEDEEESSDAGTAEIKSAVERNVIKPFEVSTDLYNALISEKTINDLALFREYIESTESGIRELTSDIKYSYDVKPKIYGTDLYGERLRVNPSMIMETMGMGNISGMYSQFSSFSMRGTDYDIFSEMLDNRELLSQQYDVLAGRWPQDKTEMVFVVSSRNYVEDTAFYTLGLKDQSKLANVLSGETIEKSGADEYTYDEILGLKFICITDPDHYREEADGTWSLVESDTREFENILSSGLELKIVGILRPRDGAAATAITSTIGYTKALTEYIIEQTNASEIVKKQKADAETDVFTGKPFKGSEAAEEAAAQAMDMSAMMAQLSPEQQAYFASLSEEQIKEMMKKYAEGAVSQASYEGNLDILGVCDLNEPSSIRLYPKDFESKDLLEDKIDEYNKKCEKEGNEAAKISYTDYIGIFMSSVSRIIKAITYVLIAFVAISLVVSSIMIAIITYISVLERTKEIGILRSIGASKKDVSRVFNAETLIEGFVSGFLGVAVTMLLNIPINMIIKHFAGLNNIAALPLNYAAILVLISILLTVIAGLIPARMASKRDPVEALRSE
ncbi:MAG: ABC transporter ATP-binding protein/permease [Lachnospiraceae bacterium]|nr:ABC transporter ATP-binding protein/permease [Lachnospiraceae bacterium]